ncbi:hypothetical protein Verru16b_00173 [Lacunisphaera limnophila]|uniref:Uncharacterized protein n=1 Tax=Lacunisphaera limnophila TaxID=1838286 RepID=A0A1I7PHP3_9BACT|nr:hypothetical protein [Lacunisphaera limnophila]AOS43132.1 hypothetical protein Verru16b_00173 [Lacunisphaera limnophila]
MNFPSSLLRRLTALLAAGLAAAAAADELHDQIGLLGPDFLVRAIPAPVLDRPADWINRDDGDYHYVYTAGDDHGQKEQVETHRYDAAHPGRVWHRQIGASFVESFELLDNQAIRFHAETDRQHGYQVDFSPGISIPAGVKAGDTWQAESDLAAFHLDPAGKAAFQGRMTATCRYVGAWRVKVPAGEFDAVLIEQSFDVAIGPAKVSDVRHLFYARGAGVVAEVEAIRATALVVIRVREKSAKVLSRLPAPAASAP